MARTHVAQHIRGLLQLEHHGGDVGADGVPARRYEDRAGVLAANTRGGVLELEAVTEHQVEAASREVPESGLETPGGVCVS